MLKNYIFTGAQGRGLWFKVDSYFAPNESETKKKKKKRKKLPFSSTFSSVPVEKNATYFYPALVAACIALFHRRKKLPTTLSSCTSVRRGGQGA